MKSMWKVKEELERESIQVKNFHKEEEKKEDETEKEVVEEK